MKTIGEFKKFYRSDLLPSLKELDMRRKKTRRKNFLTTCLFILLLIVMGTVGLLVNRMIYGEYVHERSANVPLTIVLITAIILFLFYIGKIKSNKRGFVDSYKDVIITRIVQFFEENLQYSPKGYVQPQDFIQSGLFLHNPDSYRGDDLVFGRIGKTDIAFSEVHARYKTTITDDEGGSRDKWTKIFDGLFFKADFHKDFRGRHVVLPDSTERILGKQAKIFQKMNKKFGQLIELEDIEFEKEFVVYGTDQIEARYILSASILQKLLDFKNRTGKKIRISFVKSSVFIAIPYKKELFEPNYRKSVINEEKTIQFFRDLEMAIGIVEELNLNLRIWSKQ